MATYSFLDVKAAIAGPGGNFQLGAGSANAEEGITVEQVDDVDKMDIGADGTPMHSLHASKGAHVIVRLLKTSPVNNLLSELAAYQRQSGLLHGQNTITIMNIATGDVITCQFAAFAKIPAINYAKDGGTIEWTFNAGVSDVLLGSNV